jgi:uncharacterized protein
MERTSGGRFGTFSSWGEHELLFEELSVSACRDKLKNATVGRLGVSIDALPVVLPVNFAVDGNSIVIRADPGTKLSAAMNEAVVAFEVDDFDSEARRGWSVLVQGIARQITTQSRLDRARALSLASGGGGNGSGDAYIEVQMEIVTGRYSEPVHSSNAASEV